MRLTITGQGMLPASVQACLVTNLNTRRGSDWTRFPFLRSDDHTLECCVVPTQPGLRSFRVEFSMDGGHTWLRDTVPDAWVLVDPPQVDGLRLYTMIPTVSGTVVDWKLDLKRIRGMGFNAVHLLPVTALDTSESPYSARDLFDVDQSYVVEGERKSGLAQFEEYVEEAKSLGVRLCFDLVLNHVGVNSSIVQHAPDWIVPDQSQPDGFQRARYWSSNGWCTWDDLVLINYEHPSEAIRLEIWHYMTEYALFWAKYANYTSGFVRFDNLHSSLPNFVQSVTQTVHAEYPNVGLLAEYFTDEQTLLANGPKWGLSLILATPWNSKYVPQLRDYLTYIHRVSEQIRYYMPITSHDSGSPAQEFGTVASTVPRYVAAALLGTGATGIPQGVEFGEKERIEFIGRHSRMVNPAEPMFAQFIRRVNAILTDYPAFRRGDNCRFVDNGHEAVIAAFRNDHTSSSTGFLVVCNFDTNNAQTISIDLSQVLDTSWPLTCRELLCNESFIVPDLHLDLTLPACGAKVLKFSDTST